MSRPGRGLAFPHHLHPRICFFSGIFLCSFWFLPRALVVEFGSPLAAAIISQDELTSLDLIVDLRPWMGCRAWLPLRGVWLVNQFGHSPLSSLSPGRLKVTRMLCTWRRLVYPAVLRGHWWPWIHPVRFPPPQASATQLSLYFPDCTDKANMPLQFVNNNKRNKTHSPT